LCTPLWSTPRRPLRLANVAEVDDVGPLDILFRAADLRMKRNSGISCADAAREPFPVSAWKVDSWTVMCRVDGSKILSKTNRN
jgi:hypothetical protein